MKPLYKAICILILVAQQQVAWCQQDQFMHIQSENGQFFAIHINGYTYESSEGYLVVPKITTGQYTIILSFPGTALSEYTFLCTVKDKPLSYSLKLGVDNTWSLFDMIDFTIVQGKLATQEQIKAATKKTGIHNFSNAASAGIRKIFDKATPGGKDQVYIVINDEKTDTVAIFIPNMDINEAKPVQTSKAMDSTVPGWLGNPVVVESSVWAARGRRNHF